ncbi:MAG: stage V sporulation protein AE [Christensenellaceae bacterium]|jgi:stage V sporulation protein AE|nr:stage V sporulation protein AE [Christensenellaceae bacterium]PWL98145.1 MAG: stage V sporulation protein AE [Selenomonadales bacterium]
MIWDFVKAFLIGGLICMLCQIVIDKTKLTSARILVGLVTLGVILSAVGIYKPFAQWAGAGATVPLLGFGHSLAQGAIEAVKKDGLLGAFTGGITATAGGIAAAVFFGYLNALIFSSREKK